jgi:hypothetical protein
MQNEHFEIYLNKFYANFKIMDNENNISVGTWAIILTCASDSTRNGTEFFSWLQWTDQPHYLCEHWQYRNKYCS